MGMAQNHRPLFILSQKFALEEFVWEVVGENSKSPEQNNPKLVGVWLKLIFSVLGLKFL